MALVTGASSGIGKAIAQRLAQHKMKVVACGRNIERLQELAEEVSRSSEGKIIPVQCDLRNEQNILSMFDGIRSNPELGCVDVCINNAGVMNSAPILSSTTDKWTEMLDVNVTALCICSRESVKLMKEKNVDDGFIINICSMSGHRVVSSPGSGFYSATKFAVTALSKSLTNELQSMKSSIRVMQLSPGLVETELHERGLGKKSAKRILSSIETLKPEDLADSVVYGLSAPSHVVVSDILMRPTEQMN